MPEWVGGCAGMGSNGDVVVSFVRSTLEWFFGDVAICYTDRIAVLAVLY